jgi:putative alpha-1,2-mannosidase
MSAWYILAAMGMHPICPGNNTYELTSPLVNKATIELDNRYYKGKRFTVIARNNSEENVYIQSITLNGKKINRLWITHQEIIQGGVLEFVMGKYPNKQLKGNLSSEQSN